MLCSSAVLSLSAVIHVRCYRESVRFVHSNNLVFYKTFGEGVKDVLSLKEESFVNVQVTRLRLLVPYYSGAIALEVSFLFL